MSTADRLVAALTSAQAPKAMIVAAKAGCYGDFTSESAMPIHDLVRDARAAGLETIALRAMDGEFDATREESEAWAAAQTGEMADVIKVLVKARP